jgi:hypothetical protein
MRQFMFAFFQRLSFTMLFLLLITGCKSDDPDTQSQTQSDKYVSCTIGGKNIIDNSPIAIYSAGLLDLTSVLALSSSDGYIASIKVLATKTGTYSSKTGAVYGSIGYLSGPVSANTTKDYDITKGVESTVIFSAFDAKGYLEGTFSLTGTAKDGKTISLTDGKFRLKLL